MYDACHCIFCKFNKQRIAWSNCLQHLDVIYVIIDLKVLGDIWVLLTELLELLISDRLVSTALTELGEQVGLRDLAFVLPLLGNLLDWLGLSFWH